MRNRHKTIESLQRLADRPGTRHEGETARKLLGQMVGNLPILKPFDPTEFPRGTKVFYNYWAYPFNCPAAIVGKETKLIQGETWIRMKFDHLKQARRVPVTSAKGCHISKDRISADDAEYLVGYRLADWDAKVTP